MAATILKAAHYQYMTASGKTVGRRMSSKRNYLKIPGWAQALFGTQATRSQVESTLRP
jgi:hypothetical protein